MYVFKFDFYSFLSFKKNKLALSIVRNKILINFVIQSRNIFVLWINK